MSTAGAFVTPTKPPLKQIINAIMGKLADANARDTVFNPASPNASSPSVISKTNNYNVDPDADIYNLDNMVGPKPTRNNLESVLKTPDQFSSVFGGISKRYNEYQSTVASTMRKDRFTKESPDQHAPKDTTDNTESYISGASGPEDRTSSRHDLHGHHGHNKDSYSSTKGKSDPLLDDVMKKTSK